MPEPPGLAGLHCEGMGGPVEKGRSQKTRKRLSLMSVQVSKVTVCEH